MSDAPYSNCQFRECDLPGQCRTEGKCHHPSAETLAAAEVQTCHKCGLPMSANPHPEAGKPPHYLEVGCPKECIPCLVKNRHGWATRAMKASADTARLDFMVRTGAVVQWYGETCQLHGSAGVISGAGEFYESAREAIDAAIAMEAK